MRLIGAALALAGFLMEKRWLVIVGGAAFALSFAERARLPRFLRQAADTGDSFLNPSGNARGQLPATGDTFTISANSAVSYGGVGGGGKGGCGCGG